MTKANISKSNRTKAAQSPEAVTLPDDIMRQNINLRAKKKSIVSANGTWADFFAGPRLDYDFMNDRNQPAPQTCKAIRHP
jgi:virulence-associated protein VagC